MARKKKYDKYRKKNVQKKRNNRVLLIVIGVIVVIMVFSEIKMLRHRKTLTTEKANLEKQVASEEKRTKTLEKEKEYVKTDEYIEKVAREKFGLFYPDEYVLKQD